MTNLLHFDQSRSSSTNRGLYELNQCFLIVRWCKDRTSLEVARIHQVFHHVSAPHIGWMAHAKEKLAGVSVFIDCIEGVYLSPSVRLYSLRFTAKYSTATDGM
jgi:hypothetical protein